MSLSMGLDGTAAVTGRRAASGWFGKRQGQRQEPQPTAAICSSIHQWPPFLFSGRQARETRLTAA